MLHSYGPASQNDNIIISFLFWTSCFDLVLVVPLLCLYKDKTLQAFCNRSSPAREIESKWPPPLSLSGCVAILNSNFEKNISMTS